LMITIAIIVMIFVKIEVPKELWVPMGISWGFYFAKNGGNVVNRVRGVDVGKDVSLRKGM